ncbi:type IV secretory system conjugative DNA transfer family protein [Candidatus Frankia alpina]|nr:type IV secretory system conjugative DNA transfer family protein [Candidatus Frankia alpina]
MNLPDHWAGEEYQQLAIARLVDRWIKVPMEASRIHLTSAPRFMEFTPTPQPPDAATWRPSDNPYVMHVGDGPGKTPIYARTETDVPHLAVVGGSGSGKTTTLTVPLVHNRTHGALVDIIDLKSMSFTEIGDDHPNGIAGDPTLPSRTVSGVRIHTRIEDAIRALAEFVASATAIALMQQEGISTKHLPARVLIIDEFGSFAGGAKQWWTGPGGQKKQSPVPFWLHVTLMQGRALEHRIVLGAHQMSLTLFGGSDARDLFSGRILTGTCSAQKWITTYGHVKKPAWDADVKGRGTYGPLGERPELVQIAYIPQEKANTRLRELPEAPAWFDAGHCAPWITEERILEVESSYGAGHWVPGWGHLFDDDADTDSDAEQAADTPMMLTESDQIAGVTDHVTVTLIKPAWHPSSTNDRDSQDSVTIPPAAANTDSNAMAGRITLPEACRTGVIQLRPDAARAARMRDPEFPKGQREGRDQTYTTEELQNWHQNRTAVSK